MPLFNLGMPVYLVLIYLSKRPSACLHLTLFVDCLTIRACLSLSPFLSLSVPPYLPTAAPPVSAAIPLSESSPETNKQKINNRQTNK